jgi:hypothetical protein
MIGLRPHFRQIEWIEAEGLGLRVGHHLDEQRPAREVAALDALEKVPAVALAILGDDSRGFGVGEILNPCCVRKWSFTQTSSLSALIIE